MVGGGAGDEFALGAVDGYPLLGPVAFLEGLLVLDVRAEGAVDFALAVVSDFILVLGGKADFAQYFFGAVEAELAAGVDGLCVCYFVGAEDEDFDVVEDVSVHCVED